MKYRDLHGRWGGDDAGGGNRVCWSGASVGREEGREEEGVGEIGAVEEIRSVGEGENEHEENEGNVAKHGANDENDEDDDDDDDGEVDDDSGASMRGANFVGVRPLTTVSQLNGIMASSKAAFIKYVRLFSVLCSSKIEWV